MGQKHLVCARVQIAQFAVAIYTKNISFLAYDKHKQSPFPLWVLMIHRVWPSASIGIWAVWGGGRKNAAFLGPTVPISIWQKFHLISILRVAGYKYIRGGKGGGGTNYREGWHLLVRSEARWCHPGAARTCSHGCAAAVLEAANEHPIFRLELIFTC